MSVFLRSIQFDILPQLEGLHQHSPASHVHPRSVLQRSPLVPLRNPGFQEPVATARVNEFWAVDVAGRCFFQPWKIRIL